MFMRTKHVNYYRYFQIFLKFQARTWYFDLQLILYYPEVMIYYTNAVLIEI